MTPPFRYAVGILAGIARRLQPTQGVTHAPFSSPAIVAAALFLATYSLAADWPQFRYDAGRTGASPQSLPAPLHPLWVRQLPAPRPAFPGEVRLRFDASYEPVVLGKTMFLPSMVTDSLVALDTETGEERWRFFAEGPVRFAPVAWQDNVYFVSDDGFLYCLHAADGSLRWKVRGLPADLPDRKILGNQRLMSLWPARGGPVLADGLLYFAAGLWPADGVYIHAVDPQSGRIVWSNTDSNHIAKANMDHGIAQYAGLTPQGYLAVVDGKLVVPCGAQLPAFLDPRTGRLDTYHMGWGGRIGLAKGSWFVAGVNNLLSHSGDLYDLSRRSEERFNDLHWPEDFKSELYPGSFLRLQIDPTCQRALGAFREPVFTPEAMFVNDGQTIAAYDLREGEIKPRDKATAPAYRRDDQYPDTVQGTFALRWRFPSRLKVHIKAGGYLFAGGPGTVEAIAVPDGDQAPRVAWQTAIEGTPEGILAADDKLFVVTREGRLYAFGAAPPETVVVHALPSGTIRVEDSWLEQAETIGRATSVRGGYALILGIGSGRLIEALAGKDNTYVLAIDRDADKVADVRRRLQRSGLYGTRATVLVGDPLSYPLPPYFASAVASEDWSAVHFEINRSATDAICHSLRPYGGVAYFPIQAALQEAFAKRLADQCPAAFAVRRDQGYVLLSREKELPESADWTHPLADAANSGASQDEILKPPLALLWFDGALRWHRKPGMAEVRVAKGHILVKAAKLSAIDVYTGRMLWETDRLPPHVPNGQFVTRGDSIYATVGRTCHVMDLRDGSESGTIELPADVHGTWSNLRVAGDYLVGQSGKHLVCVNRVSGSPAWTYECGRAALSIAVGNGKVFCAELLNRRKGETDPQVTKTRAFDLATGRIVWQIDSGSEILYSEPLDRLVTAGGIYHGSDGSLAVSSDKFDKLHANVACQPLFVIGRHLLWGTVSSMVAYDLETGDAQGSPLLWVRRGCTGLRASSHLITTRFRANAAYVDLASNSITPLWNVRPACNNNLFPANGVLCAPNLTGGCECNYTPNSQAYVPAAIIPRPTGAE